jgi:hypothetical protein
MSLDREEETGINLSVFVHQTAAGFERIIILTQINFGDIEDRNPG